ncbi:hypothetical protein DFH11DRAFT_1790190 [Phellopilus nigrolimitatus]|nr:hypothetical protein DFH11DRAFT_1790190 [Phellopilus nigrolimitatus]
MTDDPSSSSTRETALQRGKACKCDGGRPVCTQCVFDDCASDCEYTDKQGRTRTQILEENIALLQARVQELENPEHAQPVLLRDPYEAFRASNPISGVISDTSVNQAGIPVLGSTTSIPTPAAIPWWELEEPPAQIRDTLVTDFLPHASSVGFVLSPSHFRATLGLPTLNSERPHPALVNAVLLWALRLSSNQDHTQHEQLYLQRTILALQDAFGGGRGNLVDKQTVSRRRVHAVQVEILLAQYFFVLGRFLEGRYHANAAVSLAVSCGLHYIDTSPSTAFGTTLNISLGLLKLAPARDSLELGERVRVFWTVYIVDRCWSAALGAPCAFTDEAALGTQIDTPWPRDVEEYTPIGGVSQASVIEPGNKTVQRFLSGGTTYNHADSVDSGISLRAKVSALYERAARLLAVSSSQAQSQAVIQVELQTLARTTTQFAHSLVPLDEPETSTRSAETRETLFVVHGLSHATMIQLHSVRGSAAVSTTESGLDHAGEVLQILEAAVGSKDRAAAGSNRMLLDPILSIVGMSAAQVFVQEYLRMRRGPQTYASYSRQEKIRESIDRITEALRRGAGPENKFPIFTQQAAKIEEILHS